MDIEHLKHLLVYHIQTNEKMELSDKSNHDIWAALKTQSNLTEYWKEAYMSSRQPHYERLWNELRLYLTREAQSFPELAVYYKEVLDAMHHLNEGGSLRDSKRLVRSSETIG